MHFGFCYVGLIFLVMLMLPNIVWTKNQPKDYEKYVVNENRILLCFERIGEVLVSALALIFSVSAGQVRPGRRYLTEKGAA